MILLNFWNIKNNLKLNLYQKKLLILQNCEKFLFLNDTFYTKVSLKITGFIKIIKHSLNFVSPLTHFRLLTFSRYFPSILNLSYTKSRKQLLNKKITSSINLYNFFVNFLTKSGKKAISVKIVNNIFATLSKMLRVGKYFLLFRLFNVFNLYVEVKRIKFRRNTNFVPCFVSVKRRLHLLLTWLILIVQRDKTPISFENRLLRELYVIISNFNTSTLAKLLKKNNQLVLANRSKSHFRWY